MLNPRKKKIFALIALILVLVMVGTSIAFAFVSVFAG
jgi:hypothetical protein